MPHSHRHHHARRDFMSDASDWWDGIWGDDSGGGGNSGGGSSNNNNNGGNSNSGGNSGDGSNGQRDQGSSGGGGGGSVNNNVVTVYKTLDPTFEGEVGGYSTLGKKPQPQPTKESDPSPTEKPKPKPTTLVKEKESSHIPSVIREPTKKSTSQSVLAKATGTPTLSTSADFGGAALSPTPTSIISQPSSTADSATSNKGDGTSAGAKAGIAFGVLGGVMIVGLLVFFLFNRRRKRAADREKIEDEKFYGTGANAGANPFEPTRQSNPHAPRISLRPVTQFLPNWNLDKRASKGAAAALAPAAAAGASRGPTGGMWDRPGTSQSTNPSNPFGNGAERVAEPTIAEHHAESRSDPLTANGPAVAAGAAAGAMAAGAGAAALTRKTSMRKDSQRNVDLTLPQHNGAPAPPSPAGTEFSMSSLPPGSAPAPSGGAAAIAAAGGPPNSNVHRVQLDFKPSLEDEMELRAGDLVRLLHEYDDGWALVIRLDRSQQGVVPRTCLSARPVKPRGPPGGGPRPGPPVNPNGQFPRGPNYPPGPRQMNAQGRPMTPQGMPHPGRPGRPESPGPGRPRMGPGPGPRAMSPGPRAMSPGPRPMSPAGRPHSPGPRAQSPGPRHQGPPGPPGNRPQSPNRMDRRMSPPGPGPSPMNPAQSPPPNGPPTGPVGRKPVPGQAY